MPFIPQDERQMFDQIPHDRRTAGQRCYVYYRDMVWRWKQEPRWTTADDIYRQVLSIDFSLPLNEKAARQRAKELAWQVFFQLHVMPYEIAQREKNGDIT